MSTPWHPSPAQPSLLKSSKPPSTKTGGSDPTWNFLMNFTVYEARLRNRLTLVVKINAVRMFVDKKLVEVRVPIKELLEGVETEFMRAVSYPVKGRHGEMKGVVSFSYRVGKILVNAPRNAAVRGSSSSATAGLSTGVLVGLALGSVANSCGCGGGGGGSCANKTKSPTLIRSEGKGGFYPPQRTSVASPVLPLLCYAAFSPSDSQSPALSLSTVYHILVSGLGCLYNHNAS
ncbi:hypothetical protein L1987_61836 [Smallanthus sonchifolius]|uniref:Uncharacterized protein n=1 Tax=Smallanthus sonchifolius TaxID=185202 RepID=A0ACB9C8Q6_9ASTR|nr:hypothetical protein L1987_61836 [Smallanthus sonchifolius]